MIIIYFTTLLLINAVSSQPAFHDIESSTCGLVRPIRFNQPGGSGGIQRIWMGYESDYSDMPWAVYIEVTLQIGNQYEDSDCTGSIVNRHWIITAAHCVVNENEEGNRWTALPQHIVINAGPYKRPNSDVTMFHHRNLLADLVLADPEYLNQNNVFYKLYDLAVIRLAESLNFFVDGRTNRFVVNSICFPRQPADYNVMHTVAGFGDIGTDRNPEHRLMELRVPRLYAWQQCANWRTNFVAEFVRDNVPRWVPNFPIQPPPQVVQFQHLFCNEMGANQTCIGDSGGPMVKQRPEGWGRYELTGLTFSAWEANEAQVNNNALLLLLLRRRYPCGYLTLFIDIFQRRQWIIETIVENSAQLGDLRMVVVFTIAGGLVGGVAVLDQVRRWYFGQMAPEEPRFARNV